MADIRNVSNSVRPQEGVPRNRSIEQNHRSDVKGVVTPERTTRADNRTLEREADFLLNQNSNFEKFMSTLKQLPSAQQMMSELLFYKSEFLSENIFSGVSGPIMEELFSMMEMSRSELENFLKQQVDASTKYKGVFFDFLRNAMQGSSSEDIKYGVANFLRIYDNYSSRDHLFHQLRSSLAKILEYLPKDEQTSLSQWMNALLENGSEEAFSVNRFILKQDIMPFLAKYIKESKNLGALRDQVTLFAFQLSKYDSSGEEQLLRSIEQLIRGKELIKHFGKDDVQSISQKMLEEARAFREQQAIPEGTKKLLDLIQAGVKGELGPDMKQQYQSLLRSMLIQQSVYMPLTYLCIPVTVNGKCMTSELWIDPEDETYGYEEGQRHPKLFVKFEIEGLGQFELTLHERAGKADMELSYPEKLENFEEKIKEDMKKIGESNGLPFQTILLERLQKEKELTEVFPQLMERRNILNVKI